MCIGYNITKFIGAEGPSAATASVCVYVCVWLRVIIHDLCLAKRYVEINSIVEENRVCARARVNTRSCLLVCRRTMRLHRTAAGGEQERDKNQREQVASENDAHKMCFLARAR